MTQTTETLRTLDQRRADHAWKRIRQIAGQEKDAKEYAGEAKKLPVRIMASGLGQALVFVRAKAKKRKALESLHRDLSNWVLVEKLKVASEEKADLMQAVVDGDSDFLRCATAETLAYLTWLNRFAEAEGLTEGTD